MELVKVVVSFASFRDGEVLAVEPEFIEKFGKYVVPYAYPSRDRQGEGPAAGDEASDGAGVEGFVESLGDGEEPGEGL